MTAMTNPLEQIRELVNDWQKSRNFSGADLAHSILAILDASQGYVCVPVEPTMEMLESGMIAHHEAEVRMKDELAVEPYNPVIAPYSMRNRKMHASHVYKAMLAASKETNRE